MEFRWMLKYFLSICMDPMVIDLGHPWYFSCGRCLAPPYLLAINSTIPWYVWPNGFGPFNVCVSWLLSVVAYGANMENSSMPNIVRSS